MTEETLKRIEILDRAKRITKLTLNRIHARILDIMKKNINQDVIDLLETELIDFKAEKMNFDRIQLDLLPLVEEVSGKEKKIEEIEEQWSADMEKYRILVSSITAKISTIKRNFDGTVARESILNATFRENNEQGSIRLPKIEVPSFNGDIRDWNDFQHLFKNLVHDNPVLSNVQRLYYLKNSMKDSAAELIKDYSITDSNFAEAWNALCNRYDNKRATIRAHLRDFFDLPKIKNEKEIRMLLDDSAKSLRSLKSLGENVDNWSTMITYWLSTRLDDKTLKEWELSITDFTRFPDLKQLHAFLSARAAIMEETTLPKKIEKSDFQTIAKKTDWKRNSDFRPKTTTLMTTNPKCYVCSSDHFLVNCPDFSKKSPEQRYDIVKAHKLCINCFCRKHSTRDCTGPKCQTCNKNHHTLLHRPVLKKESVQASSVGPEKLTLQINKDTIKVLLPTAVVNIVKECPIFDNFARVILDSCSQTNLISESLIKRLKIPVFKNTSTIGWIGNKTFLSKFSCSIVIGSRFCKDIAITVNADVVPYIPYNVSSKELDRIQKNAKIEEPAEFQFLDGKVEILLGAEHYEHCMINERKFYENLAIRRTIFGNVIFGSSNFDFPTKVPPNYQCFLAIDEQLKRFWELEEVNAPNVIHDEELACVKHFESTYQRDNEGRFVVKLPLKGDVGKLSKTYTRAVNSLQRLERNLDMNTKNAVSAFMKEYEDLNHMKKLENKIDQNKYFIPFQAVLRPESSTTKVRIVFNASARCKNDLSLNDLLMKGPQIQPDISTILLKFRRHCIAFTADIKMMYRQILVHPADAKLQKILWRYSETDPVSEFQLNTLTYGTTPGSFIATKCLSVLAENMAEEMPAAAAAISSEFYMDDLMTGSHDVDSAIKLQSQIHSALLMGGFSLRKYVSNSTELMNRLDQSLCSKTDIVDLDLNDEVLVLGLKWYPRTDKFQVKINLPEINTEVTKRLILSELLRAFDPLGFLSTAIVEGKLLLQKLWKYQLSWDEVVPIDLQTQYLNYREQLKSIRDLCIERRFCMYPVRDDELQLVGFCDSSDKAYAAVVYARCFNKESAHSYIVCAKSRVSPLREETVPRLELCGALLLAELMKKVSTILNVPSNNIFCFSDSTIVLCWLRKNPSDLKVFVANRVARINRLFSADHWYYVRSDENPADLATREKNTRKCVSKFWLEGPPWLSDGTTDLRNFGRSIVPSGNLPEIKKVKNICGVTKILNNDILNLVNRFSDYLKLIRVVAYMIRFCNNCKVKPSSNLRSKTLSIEELDYAFLVIVRSIQSIYYSKELNMLKCKNRVSKKSVIFTFNPIIDQNSVIRVGGRLSNSNFSFSKKHPIILPVKCNFTMIYLRYVHHRYYHSTPSFIITFVNQKFRFVGGLRNAVKQIYRDCPTCRKFSRYATEQIMGQLPKDRISISRPFTVTGIDFAGPFILKPVGHRSKVRFKSYVAVFVCYCVKAVHLEVVSDLTTSSFFAALKRFTARRGCPATIYSDNATNFVGTQNLLTGCNIQDYLVDNHIVWKFNPPRAPHHGGVFEAAVRVMKEHLKKTVGEQILTFEELGTLIAEIEAIMNSRPLCPKSTNDVDEYLTPGHFLTGTHLLITPENEEVHTKLSDRWRLIQNLKSSFWKKWRNDYLNTFQRIYKWNRERDNLKIDDIVILKNENLSPSKYQLGRVTEIHPGIDGKVRVVKVKTSQGQFLRPITKLIPFLPQPGGVCLE